MIARTADGFILDPDGFAVPGCDVLSDWYAEHSDDPFEGPPHRWPCWTDDITVGIGAPITPDEAIPDPPVPDPDQLPGEETPLEGPDPDDTGDFPDPDRMGEAERELSHDFEPDPDEIADYLERLHYEEGISRFV